MQFSALNWIIRWASAAISCVLTFHCIGQRSLAAPARPSQYNVGLAKIDITPDGSIRLSGFSHRKTESVGIRQRIYARAMAIRAADGGDTAILITVDSIGIPIAV